MQDPFVGTWKLNPENSAFDANHRPTAATMVFELEGDYLIMQAQGTDGRGQPVSERPQKFLTDGQAHPLPGLPGLVAVATRPDSNTLLAEARREDGSVVGAGSYVVSKDGGTLTATTSGMDSQLRTFTMRTAWDRQ